MPEEKKTKKTSVLFVRIDDELKSLLQKAADNDERSLQGETIFAIKQFLSSRTDLQDK